MQNWNRERQDIIYTKKLQNVKSTLPKAQSSTNHPIQKKKLLSSDPKSIQKQHNLKYLLREFGLIQYLRRMYELGYDDDSLMKLGLLSQKEFEELLTNLKLFPGHQVKMQSLFQYIRQIVLQNSIPMKKPGTSNARKRPMTNQKKAKSSSAKPKYRYETKKSANPMLNSFMRGEFGYEYYCSSNTAYAGENKQVNLAGKESDVNKEQQAKKDKEGEDISNDIDRLLDYYMAQLNEELDNSDDSIDDSSLSNNRFNEIVKATEEPKVIDKEVKPKEDKAAIDKNIIPDNKPNPQKEAPIIPSTIQKEPITRTNGVKEIIDKPEPMNQPISKPNDNKEIEDEIIEEFFEKKDKEEKQQQEEPQHHSSIGVKPQKISKTEGNVKPNDNGTSHPPNQTDPSEEEEEAYTKEQAMFDNIRLTKSYEAESLRQNPEQFDIEYMCRCLALAIMKHLESSKDKKHITELLSQNETFTFFNSLYNSNVSFLSNFFTKEQQSTGKISNLDQLDLIEKAAEVDKPSISFMNNIAKGGDDRPGAKEDKKKLQPHFKDVENNIKFIDELFSVSKKIRYKNLSERTLTLLNKELSYINEVDSQQSSKLDNSNLTNRKETTDNILRQSLQQLVMKSSMSEGEMAKPAKTEGNKAESEEHSHTPIGSHIKEEIAEEEEANQLFESGDMESNYAIDATTVDKLRAFLLKQAEVYDDDYLYSAQRIQTRKYVAPPDPQVIFEFCANILISTKMEKEVIIVALIYLERLIFNTGLLLTSRNWRRIAFIVLVIASKIWDDDSFENNHFAQVFTHLKIGEINLLERIFLELINYKVYVKCSEYFKYFFIIKSIALKFNYNGANLIPISVEHMMKIQEYAFQMQKKMKKKYSLVNSANF